MEVEETKPDPTFVSDKVSRDAISVKFAGEASADLAALLSVARTPQDRIEILLIEILRTLKAAP